MSLDIFAYQTGSGRTRYLIATYRDGQYTAGLTAEGRRLTGSQAAFARTPGSLATFPVQTYAHRSSAQRALARRLGG